MNYLFYIKLIKLIIIVPIQYTTLTFQYTSVELLHNDFKY